MSISTKVLLMGAAGNVDSGIAPTPLIATITNVGRVVFYKRNVVVGENNYIYFHCNDYDNNLTSLMKIDPSDGSTVWAKTHQKWGSCIAYGNDTLYTVSNDDLAGIIYIRLWDEDGNITASRRATGVANVPYHTIGLAVLPNGNVKVSYPVNNNGVFKWLILSSDLQTTISSGQITNTLNNYDSVAGGTQKNVFSDGSVFESNSITNYNSGGFRINYSTASISESLNYVGNSYGATILSLGSCVDENDNCWVVGLRYRNLFQGWIAKSSGGSLDYGYQFRNATNQNCYATDVATNNDNEVVACGVVDGGTFNTYYSNEGFLACMETDGTKTKSLLINGNGDTINGINIEHLVDTFYVVTVDRADFYSNSAQPPWTLHIMIIDTNNLPSGTYDGLTFTPYPSSWFFASQVSYTTASAGSNSNSSTTWSLSADGGTASASNDGTSVTFF